MTETTRWLTETEQHAWRSFVSLQEKLVGRLAREVQADSGLSGADYGVLVHLTEVPEGRLPVLALAKAVEWEKSRMSHHVNRMAKRGLVVREDCPTDGRVAFIAVTPAGREAIAAAAPAMSKRSVACSSIRSARQSSPCSTRSPTGSSKGWTRTACD